MVALIALNLIFFLIASFAIYRSSRPWALVSLYVLLTVSVSVVLLFLSLSKPDLFGGNFEDLARAWWPPQQGDPMGTAQIVAYFITTAIVGNLASLFIVSCLAIRMVARRQAG